MANPLVYADFQNLDDENRLRLTCAGTHRDLERQGIELREGLPLTLYSDDANAAGQTDKLLADGVVQYNEVEKCWVSAIDWDAIRHEGKVERENGSLAVPAGTVRDFFETDYFSREGRLNKSMSVDYPLEVSVTNNQLGTETRFQVARKLHFDFEANAIYSAFFIQNPEAAEFAIAIGRWIVDAFAGNPLHTAPPALQNDIALRRNEADRFHSSKRLIDTRYFVIYFSAELSQGQKEELYRYADSKGVFVKIRDRAYARVQAMNETPLAFISHDSRDKEAIARPLAQELAKLLGRVWFDEFSLRIGDSLRESIERGLKTCKRCVLVLTPNFLANTGWTKTEFNSMFTRELLEKENVVIPVWAGVSAKQVYEYSPSLADRLAANWSEGCDKVALKIRDVILREHY